MVATTASCRLVSHEGSQLSYSNFPGSVQNKVEMYVYSQHFTVIEVNQDIAMYLGSAHAFPLQVTICLC